MTVINEAFQWFVKAKTDLHAAAILVDTSEDKFCDLICFLSQQAAEKSLKGYLVSQGLFHQGHTI
ncbi:MAG: HEPN domain-containing protein [Deltaproteobacteria bacterium]|jgi:HEPN domain-containing protein|nr:HEPN domain-containing protein [Deltaproteobacteria bacterium]